MIMAIDLSHEILRRSHEAHMIRAGLTPATTESGAMYSHSRGQWKQAMQRSEDYLAMYIVVVCTPWRKNFIIDAISLLE